MVEKWTMQTAWLIPKTQPKCIQDTVAGKWSMQTTWLNSLYPIKVIEASVVFQKYTNKINLPFTIIPES